MHSVQRSARADDAIEDLASRMADHRDLVQAATDFYGRHEERLSIERRRQNTLSGLVAVAESFVVGRLLDAVPTVKDDELGTWKKRTLAWKTHLGVELATASAWKPLMGFVEARNAVQHGLGRLTDRQLGKYRDEILGFLGACAVGLNGDLVIVREDDIARCADVSRGMIEWIDGAAPSR